MNKLGRDIEVGEVVVLDNAIFKVEYQALHDRLYKVTGGDGRHHETGDTGLDGRRLSSGEEAIFTSELIDTRETEWFQSKFGERGERYALLIEGENGEDEDTESPEKPKRKRSTRKAKEDTD